VQVAELRNRKFDLVLARTVRPLTADDMHVETLFNDQVVIAAAASNRWARRRKVNLVDLVDEAWTLTRRW
jgi:DNA-binding transcriptional LysR family regulator